MTANHHTTPIILGQSLTSVSATANHTVGTKVQADDGGTFVYVQAASGVAQYAGVVIGVDYVASSFSTAALTDGSGTAKEVGWAQTSIASGSYGWIQLSGRPKGKLAANCADRVTLYATSTAGVMDDATVSAAYITGVVSKTTISNATAVTLMVPEGAHARPWSNPA